MENENSVIHSGKLSASPCSKKKIKMNNTSDIRLGQIIGHQITNIIK